MVIFLYGPDDYRRLQKKRDVIAEFRKKHSGLGIGLFDFEIAEDKNAFEEFVANQSIFESAKLAVVEHPFEVEAKSLAKLIAPFLEHSSINVLISDRDKPVKALGFLLEKPVFSQKFEPLEDALWNSFIAAEAKKAGVTLGPAAIQFLGTLYQGNTWGLVTEVQKLASLKSVIDKKDLDAFDLEAAPNYWALLNGLKNVDVRTRLYALEKMLSLNDPPAKIFNILASQWREKTPLIAELDFAVKSGKLEYDEAVLQLTLGG